MKILVVGATGTVGSALVEELARRGAAVVAATRDPQARSLPEGVEVARFDLADEVSVRRSLEGVDRVFVLAPPGLPDQARLWSSLFHAAQDAGVRHVVLMTAKGAGEDTPHGQGEAALRATRLGWTLIRPTFFMQNFATYSGSSILSDGAFYYPAGQGRAAFVDVRDIAAVAAEALLSPDRHAGNTYTLTGPAALSMEEVASHLSAALGRQVRYVDVGEREYHAALQAQGLPAELAGMFTYLYNVVVRQGWAADTSDDVTRVLGREPTTFEAFSRDLARSWRAGA